MPVVAIVGAGFSGTLLALHLLRNAPPGTSIKLIERRRNFGFGQAYSTGSPSHLLNVRAGGMSAFREQPDHFLEWLNSAPHRLGENSVKSTGFVPRRDFGLYVRELLEAALEEEEDRGCAVDLVNGAVEDISICSGTAMLSLREGRKIVADLAVLATGTIPTAPPPVADPWLYRTARYRPDPWAADALDSVHPDRPVLLIGSGLTAVDVVMSLLDRGHRGKIMALSRRGLLPQPHAAGLLQAVEFEAYSAKPLALLCQLRAEARVVEDAGGDWRAVVDAIRPFTTDIWQLMPARERARFLRHLRPYWDAHRHRMAPQVAERIRAARASGQLTVTAGRIMRFDAVAQRRTVAVRYRPRGAERLATLHADCVINCSGPGADFARLDDPMMSGLMRNGLVRPDELGLGLDVSPNCALLGRDGSISRHLFAVGPLTRGTFWEMTAVPDIRNQCDSLGRHLAAMLPRGDPGWKDLSPVPVPGLGWIGQDSDAGGVPSG
jgi:uncharacterized NAD(P)/FAD-binding protein YdhS